MKGKLSDGDVYGSKARGASANSPKICLCTVIFEVVSEEKHNINEFFPYTTVFND